jgi:hypothetical protein
MDRRRADGTRQVLDIAWNHFDHALAKSSPTGWPQHERRLDLVVNFILAKRSRRHAHRALVQSSVRPFGAIRREGHGKRALT